MTLHILSSLESLSHCLPALHTGDDLLLTLDAVYLSLQSASLPCKPHVLRDDLAARGLIDHATDLVVVGMDGFVELTTRHQHCLSW